MTLLFLYICLLLHVCLLEVVTAMYTFSLSQNIFSVHSHYCVHLNQGSSGIFSLGRGGGRLCTRSVAEICNATPTFHF